MAFAGPFPRTSSYADQSRLRGGRESGFELTGVAMGPGLVGRLTGDGLAAGG